MLPWLFGTHSLRSKRLNCRVFLHSVAFFWLCLAPFHALSEVRTSLPRPPEPKRNCQPWLSNLPAKLSAKYKERIKNGWRIYQYLCIGDTKCVAFLDQGESLHHNPELKAQWKRELKDFRFEKRGGRILWEIDAGGMNCHSYGCFMVGIPGISTDMMLSPTENRLFKNATFDELLKSFFDLTPAKSVNRLHFDEWLAANAKDGDLLLYYDGDEVIHTGVVNVRKDSKGTHYLIESKLGNGPVVEAPAELTYDYYAETTSVRLARVKISGHH